MSDRFTITPGQAIYGDITVSGDKSISHRAVIFAAIADGVSIISNLSKGTDVRATIEAMRALGVEITLSFSKEDDVEIRGVGLHGLKPPQNPIDCGNAGTAMRLLCGLLSAQSFDSVLMGDHSLMQRPMARIAVPLRLMGAKITLSSQNTAPIEITGGQKLTGITYESVIPSAQVKSGVMIAGLYANGKTRVIENTKTRDHTERMLSYLSQNHRHLLIPGDISSAAFFIVLASITPGSDLIIRDVGVNPFRTGIIAILKLMGADITILNERLFGLEPVADIRIKHAVLHGITIPTDFIAASIDELPVIFIAAAIAKGKTVLRGAAELRVKESDRLAVMAGNLQRLGISVVEYDDGLVIAGDECFQGGHLDSKGDHRIAMAFSVAGHIAKGPVSIDNCDFVKTSFPEFVEVANRVGLSVRDSDSDSGCDRESS